MKLARRVAIMSILLVTGTNAASATPQVLPPSSIAQIETSNGTYLCGLIGGAYIPGNYQASSQKFNSLQDQIQQAKKKKRLARGAQLTKLNKTIKQLRSSLSYGTAACSSVGTSTATPTPAPTQPPAQSTPTPSPLGCYDEARNARPGNLGIPTGSTGNFFIGQLLFSRTCSSCHIASDRAGYDFNELTSVLPGPNMNLNLSVQERAHLAAYLNYPNC